MHQEKKEEVKSVSKRQKPQYTYTKSRLKEEESVCQIPQGFTTGSYAYVYAESNGKEVYIGRYRVHKGRRIYITLSRETTYHVYAGRLD